MHEDAVVETSAAERVTLERRQRLNAVGDGLASRAMSLQERMQHPDFGEAHEAFKQERPPRFKGAPQ